VIVPCIPDSYEVALIVGLALAVRLFGLTRPYISAHWIKQLQIAPIALNFYKHGYNILWPETDYSADTPGYIEIEFQLVTWLTALLYPLFGVHEWVGRLVTISFSMVGIWLLYLLVRRHLGRRAATYGLLFYSFAPSSVYFSRVLMSEPAMLCLSIALVYLFDTYIRTLRPLYWIGAVLCGAMAFLVKLPTLHLIIPLAYLAHRRYGWRFLVRPELWALGLFATIPALLYYWHAHHNIGPHYFTVGVGFGGQMWFSPSHFMRPASYSLMLSRLQKEHLTAVGLVLLVIGALCRPRRFYVHLFHWWLFAVILYMIVVSGGNLRQNYYQLPLLPPSAALVGIGWANLSRIRCLRPGAGALVPVFLILAVWGAQPFYEEYTPILRAAAALDRLDPHKQPVIVMPPGYGCLYYFHRPGWVGREHMGKPPQWIRSTGDVPGPEYIEDRMRRGARWAVYFNAPPNEAAPGIYGYLASHFSVALKDPDFTIFDLTRRHEESLRH
jgi:hypothetical protein